MKKVVLLLLLSVGFVSAQDNTTDNRFDKKNYKYETVRFDDMQEFKFYSKLKNGRVYEYISSKGESLKVGDVLTLGLPYGGGDHLVGGNNNNTAAKRKFDASATSMRYHQVVSGDPYNGGRIGLKILAAAAGGSDVNLNWEAPLEGNFHGEQFVIKRIRVYRLKGGKKKKPYIGIAIQPVNGALGINKNAFIRDFESAWNIGELIDPDNIGKLTREQARAELRILKEDLDLGILTQDEFDAMKDEIIMKTIKE